MGRFNLAKMRSPAFPPRRPAGFIRVAIPAALLIFIFYYLSHDSSYVPEGYLSNLAPQRPMHHIPTQVPDLPTVEPGKKQEHEHAEPVDVQEPMHGHPEANAESTTVEAAAPTPTKLRAAHSPTHPIDHLIGVAEKEFSDLLAKESNTLRDAAAAYRTRRGRHPPPGFNAWYEFAKERNAVIVEDFFDQVYHDLNPFWGLDPATIRKEAWDFEMVITVRNGRATAKSDWFWTKIWLDMLRTIEHLLPDMDIPLNAMDEPRLIVPWEDINFYMQKEKKGRKLTPLKEVIGVYEGLPPPGEPGVEEPPTREKGWEKTKPFWLLARRGCPPKSESRTADVVTRYNSTPIITAKHTALHMHEGYVSNSTLSRSFCHQPDLQDLQGIFIEPLSTSTSKVLFPLFGGSKLATNNEILLPAPMYWNEEERFTGGNDHGLAWDDKKSQVVWRGVATGGQNTATNWKRFQRHRFVSMNNGTKLSMAEDKIQKPVNFALPDNQYDLAAQKERGLGQWVEGFADVAFTDLMCFPRMDKGQCNYTGPYFAQAKGLKMAEMFRYKYLPDIDGNSFSGRYLGFLRSTSLPIKATLWKEWHDSRLVAWKHFIPMDNRFSDYYGIMEYFLGYGESVPGHDHEARKIATDGKAWAEKVLRKEDMQIYVFRLLLEYARVFADNRERLGWIEDLEKS